MFSIYVLIIVTSDNHKLLSVWQPFLWRLFVGIAKTPNLNYQNFGHNMNVLTNSLHEVWCVSNPLSNTYIIAAQKWLPYTKPFVVTRGYQ